MGFFDKLSKVVKAIDNVADEVKEGLDKANVNLPWEQKNDGGFRQADVNQANTYTGAASGIRTPDFVMASATEPIGPYRWEEYVYWDGEDGEPECKYGYEVPEDFRNIGSCGAAEIFQCFVYKQDDSDYEKLALDKPYFTIEVPFGDRLEEFKQTGTIKNSIFCKSVSGGNLFCRAKMQLGDYMTYFYGIDLECPSEWLAGLVMWYRLDVVGTPLEDKLTAVLDHAAETLRISKE